MFNFFRSFIFKFSPEVAHSLAIKALKLNNFPINKIVKNKILETEFFGKLIPTPVGVAAGFDKNAEVYNPLFNLGFGFVEVGTITPKPQYGNPKPRVFRLEEDNALINRLGFNNTGSEDISSRITKEIKKGILGINIGPNKNTKNRIEDYLNCFKKFQNLGDYITINISSPNTEGLRNFHNQEEMKRLLVGLNKIKKEKKIEQPIAIKISPDINEEDIGRIVELVKSQKIQSIIVSNTTDNNRENLSDMKKNEVGGLSGQPLKDISTDLIKKFYKETKGEVQIIGVGGVDSGQSAFEKITAGADAVQLYTGMVYKGPGIVKEIKKELISILKKENLNNISEAVGINA